MNNKGKEKESSHENAPRERTWVQAGPGSGSGSVHEGGGVLID